MFSLLYNKHFFQSFHCLGIYSPEAMDNNKALEAWRFFQEGWTQTIAYMKVCPDVNIILKCDKKFDHHIEQHLLIINLGLLLTLLAMF